MSLYYSIFVQKDKAINYEKISKMLGGELNVPETIINIKYINANRFFELMQLFPFEEARDPYHKINKDYEFSESQKEVLKTFLQCSTFIIFYDDCTDCCQVYSKSNKTPINFSTCDMRFWNDTASHEKERILDAFENANINFEEFKQFFKVRGMS